MKQIFLLFVLFSLVLSVKAQDCKCDSVCTNDSLYTYTCDCLNRKIPVNNYSGLNSLRARLANRSWNGRESLADSLTTEFGNSNLVNERNDGNNMNDYQDGNEESRKPEDFPDAQKPWSGITHPEDIDEIHARYIKRVLNGNISLGVPLFLFFKLGSTDLLDWSQLLNIDVMAELAMTNNLSVKITGAADSATGTTEANESLALARAEYISSIFQEKGVSSDRIMALSEGGIETFSPLQANRVCRVELYVNLPGEDF